MRILSYKMSISPKYLLALYSTKCLLALDLFSCKHITISRAKLGLAYTN